MANKNLFQKIVLIALAVIILFALVAPVIFAQTSTAPKQEKLLNGLKVLMWPDASADRVYVNIRVHAGSAFDPQGKEGVMRLLADNLFPNEAAREFFSEDLGGNLDVVTTYDYIQINASSKPDQFLSMLETLAAAVSNMAIDKDVTAKLKDALLAKVKTLEADPGYIADRAAAQRLYGTFPYGRPQLGTTTSIAKIDFADLIDARARFLTADNATIAVTGNFDRALGYRAIRRYFGTWLKADRKTPTTFRQPDEPDSSPQIVTFASVKEPLARFSFRGLARSDKHWAAAKVLAKVINWRLVAAEPRESVIDIYAGHEARILPGDLVIRYRVAPQWPGLTLKGATAKAEGLQQMLADISKGIQPNEFNKAKAETQMELTSKTTADWWLDEDTYKTAPAAAEMQAAANVTPADVQRVAERLAKNRIVTVIALKSAE